MSMLTKLAAKLTLDTKGYRKGLQEAENKTGTFAKGVGKLGPMIGAAFSASAIIAFSKVVSDLNKDTENSTRAFERFGNARLLNDLREATGGMVNDLKLMQQAIQAVNLNLNAADLPAFFKFATIRAAETGMEVDHLVESIVTGIGRESRLVLDNLGISLIALNKEIAKGGTFAEAATRLIKRVGDESNTSIKQAIKPTKELAAAWENLVIVISTSGIAGHIDDLIRKTSNWLNLISKYSSDNLGRDRAFQLFKNLDISSEDIGANMGLVIQTLREQIAKLEEEGRNAFKYLEEGMMLAPSGREFLLQENKQALEFLKNISKSQDEFDKFVSLFEEFSKGTGLPAEEMLGPIGIYQEAIKKLKDDMPTMSLESAQLAQKKIDAYTEAIQRLLGTYKEVKKEKDDLDLTEFAPVGSIAYWEQFLEQLRNAQANLPQTSRGFAQLAEDIEEVELRIRSLKDPLAVAAETFANTVITLNIDTSSFDEAMMKLEQLNRAFSDAAADGIAAFAEMVGSVIGGEALTDSLSNFVGRVANLLKGFGAMMISYGISLEVLKNAKDGYTLIAAGAALVAIGAAMSVQQKKISSTAGQGVSAGGGSYSSGVNQFGEYDYNREIVMVARGDDLVAVLNSTNEKQSFLGGV